MSRRRKTLLVAVGLLLAAVGLAWYRQATASGRCRGFMLLETA